MTARSGAYRVTVAGGLRVATGPLALIAANVAALVARGYRVWVRDGDDRVVEISGDSRLLNLIYHPGSGAAGDAPAWGGPVLGPVGRDQRHPHQPRKEHHPMTTTTTETVEHLAIADIVPDAGNRKVSLDAQFVASIRTHGVMLVTPTPTPRVPTTSWPGTVVWPPLSLVARKAQGLPPASLCRGRVSVTAT